jgi:hypothetical protein
LLAGRPRRSLWTRRTREADARLSSRARQALESHRTALARQELDHAARRLRVAHDLTLGSPRALPDRSACRLRSLRRGRRALGLRLDARLEARSDDDAGHGDDDHQQQRNGDGLPAVAHAIHPWTSIVSGAAIVKIAHQA